MTSSGMTAKFLAPSCARLATGADSRAGGAGDSAGAGIAKTSLQSLHRDFLPTMAASTSYRLKHRGQLNTIDSLAAREATIPAVRAAAASPLFPADCGTSSARETEVVSGRLSVSRVL